MKRMERALQESGWEDVGNGHWICVELDQGSTRCTTDEAVYIELGRRADRIKKDEGRIEWFQQQLDAIRSALGLTCTYTELPEAVKQIVRSRGVIMEGGGHRSRGAFMEGGYAAGSEEGLREAGESAHQFARVTSVSSKEATENIRAAAGRAKALREMLTSDDRLDERIGFLAANINSLLERMTEIEAGTKKLHQRMDGIEEERQQTGRSLQRRADEAHQRLDAIIKALDDFKSPRDSLPFARIRALEKDLAGHEQAIGALVQMALLADGREGISKEITFDDALGMLERWAKGKQ